jgi:hypothetical protein
VSQSGFRCTSRIVRWHLRCDADGDVRIFREHRQFCKECTLPVVQQTETQIGGTRHRFGAIGLVISVKGAEILFAQALVRVDDGIARMARLRARSQVMHQASRPIGLRNEFIIGKDRSRERTAAVVSNCVILFILGGGTATHLCEAGKDR